MPRPDRANLLQAVEALDALGVRLRAEMAAGGDPYRADLLPDPGNECDR